jgi:hypothetical protein
MSTSIAFFVTLSGPARTNSKAMSGDGRVASVESDPALMGGTTTGEECGESDSDGAITGFVVVVPCLGAAVVPGGGLAPVIAGESEGPSV